MRWVSSVSPTLLLLATGRRVAAGIAGAPASDGATLMTASAAGSELPWWTPIVVSLLLLSAAFAYWWRHRPRRPPADPEQPDLAESTDPTEEGWIPPAPGSDGNDGGFTPPRFDGAVRPLPSL